MYCYAGALYVVDKWKEDNVNTAKQQAIEFSYTENTSTTETDDNGNIINKITIQPNNNKDAYEISYNKDANNIENIKKKLEAKTPKSASQFSEFELAVLGALMDNGSDLDYYTKEQLKCFPAFIKAEACTQYLDLRPNSQKMKNGKYEPRNIKDLKEEEVPGVILVQRTNTKDNSSTILEYKQKADFDKMVKENNKDAIKYFTISDEGNLVIAKWEHIKITVNGSYPDHLDDSEKDTPKDENIIRTEEIPYSEYIKKYTMPFEFLVQLLVVTEEPDFCIELVDHVLESKIVINIEEQETFSETTEEKNYKVHSKDEKRLDYNIKVGDNSVESGEEFLKKKKDDENKDCTNYSTEDMTVIVNTQRTTHSYVFEILEADTWIAHYTKEYQKQNAKDDVSGPNSTDVKGEYKELGTKDIVDQSEISSDGDVQDFIGENKSNYDQQIIDPINITITSGKHDNGDKFKQIHYIHNGSVERVNGLVNGGTVYNEIKDDRGHGTGEYNLPISLGVVMKEVPATEKTAKIPSITYVYVLNEAQTKYELQNTVNTEVIVTKLNIKEFEKIDLKVTTTITTTNYPADPTPKINTHIYATKDGKPGKGHGDKNTEYEKFLVAYDNNKNARDQINSIDSWLYEMMERESTLNFIDIVKYLLYMYDGKYRGVKELEGFEDIFAPDEFKSASIAGGAFAEMLRSYENNALRLYMNGESNNYSSVSEYVKADRTQYKLYYTSFDGCLNFSYGVMVRDAGGNLNNTAYFKEEGIDLQSLINQYNSGQDVYVDVEIIDRIYLKIINDKRNAIKEKIEQNGASMKPNQIDALVNVAYQYGNCGQYISGENNIAKIYNKYYEKNPEDFKNKAVCQTAAGSLAHFFVTGNYPDREKYNWLLFHEGRYFLADGTEIKGSSEVADFALQFVGENHSRFTSYNPSNGVPDIWFGADWCAMFVSYCYNECGLIPDVLYQPYASCAMARWLRDRGELIEDSGYVPQPGDIIFFSNDGWTSYHTGIVTSSDGTNVYTVEGNSGPSSSSTYWAGSSVLEHQYSLTYSNILGYFSPYN